MVIDFDLGLAGHCGLFDGLVYTLVYLIVSIIPFVHWFASWVQAVDVIDHHGMCRQCQKRVKK